MTVKAQRDTHQYNVNANETRLSGIRSAEVRGLPLLIQPHVTGIHNGYIKSPYNFTAIPLNILRIILKIVVRESLTFDLNSSSNKKVHSDPSELEAFSVHSRARTRCKGQRPVRITSLRRSLIRQPTDQSDPTDNRRPTRV
ncbi:hypothetical protein CBL_02653 [Carabus blaptoides fortunei]